MDVKNTQIHYISKIEQRSVVDRLKIFLTTIDIPTIG